MMGWLSSSGSVARMIGPIVASYSLQYGGPRLVFGLMVIIMAVTLVVVGFRYACENQRTNFHHNYDWQS